MKKYVTVFLLIFYSFFLNAQKPELEFERILDKNGVPLTGITIIQQDSNGLLWLAGYSGIFLYDGIEARKIASNAVTKDIKEFFAGKKGNVLIEVLNNEKIDFSNFKLNKNSDYQTIIDSDISLSQVIEDKNENLWVLSSGGAFNFFNKKQNKLKKYSPNYTKKKDSAINRLEAKSHLISELVNIVNFQDTCISFEIEKNKKILLVSVGEGRSGQMSDYGTLYSDTDTLWSMDYEKTSHAGGAGKNRVETTILNLKKGKYTLNYKSDDSHSHGNWNEPKPNKINFYGCKIFELPSEFENFFNEATENIIPQHIYSITTNNEGDICLLTKPGIYTGNDTNGFQLQRINYADAFDLKSNNNSGIILTGFVVDKNNCFWIGTHKGLISFNPKLNKIEAISNRFAYRLYLDKKNQRIWFFEPFRNTTSEMSPFCYDINTKTKYQYHLKEMINSKFNIEPFTNLFQDYYIDKDGNFYIASTLGVFKSKLKKFELHKFDIFRFGWNTWRPFIKRESKIYFLDESWPQLNKYLLEYNLHSGKQNKYNLHTNKLSLNKDFFISSNDSIWFFDNNILYFFDKENEQLKDSILLKDSDNKILSLFEDKKKRTWVFTLNGIFKLNKLDLKLESYIPFKIAEYERNNIIDFIMEIDNRLLARTFQGVYSIDTEKKEVIEIVKFDNKYEHEELYYGNIFYDKNNNNLWFATETKLYLHNLEKKITEEFIYTQTFENNSSRVSSTHVIKKSNNVWVSSSSGLYKFNIEEKTFKKYSKKNGLPDNNISRMVFDSSGDLWVATYKSISKFVFKTEQFVNYFLNKDYNILTLEYNSTDSIYRENNKIGFFGKLGLISFNPDNFNKAPPAIAITKFIINVKEYKTDSLVYLKKTLRLNYDQNFISLEFAALDYSDPKRNQYAYMLKGIDKDWIYTDYKDRKAKYTNLAPGKYTFRVKASNNDGIWNEEGVSLKIIITPPFWKTWWFYTLEVLFIIFLIYLFIKFRERKLKKDNEKLETIVKERTQEIVQQKEEIETQKEEIQTIADNLIVSNEEVTKQKDKIAEIHKHITESIEYASRIQHAILPPKELISKHLPDHFILFKPRDIVSGDFYWLKQIGNYTVYAAADCTGHGVPGAFMSMLGISFLNEIVTKTRFDNAGEILNRLRKKIKTSLRQTGKDGESKDGMDIAVCVIDNESLQLEYSGAYNPLYIIRKGELTEIKATRNPVGIYLKEKLFENHKFQLEKGDVIYTFSDGYIDQFGGENESRFKSKNFKKLLLEINNKPMQEQRKILDAVLLKWQGKTEQTDDIVVFGVRI